MIMKYKIIWILAMMMSLHAYSQKGNDNGTRKGNLSIGASIVASSSKGKRAASKAIDNDLTSFCSRVIQS